MAGELILDTGPLVALLDEDQKAHDRCREFFSHWTRPVLSTEAVLTEATHLLARVRNGPEACLDFFLRGAALLVPVSRARVERSRELVHRYADIPMDYADATLVALADEIGTDRVFTLDRRGFETYRLRRKRAFKIVP